MVFLILVSGWFIVVGLGMFMNGLKIISREEYIGSKRTNPIPFFGKDKKYRRDGSSAVMIGISFVFMGAVIMISAILGLFNITVWGMPINFFTGMLCCALPIGLFLLLIAEIEHNATQG